VEPQPEKVGVLFLSERRVRPSGSVRRLSLVSLV
jgi:hypothetical protein